VHLAHRTDAHASRFRNSRSNLQRVPHLCGLYLRSRPVIASVESFAGTLGRRSTAARSVRRRIRCTLQSNRLIEAFAGQSMQTVHSEHEQARLARARLLVASALQRFTGPWLTQEDTVVGPRNVAVRVNSSLHGGEPNHLDFGIVLDRTQPDSPVVWDCAGGFA